MAREPSTQRAPRDSRINVRTTGRQEQVLRQAAAATDKSMTDFILESAVTEAERVLADRRWFLLDEEKWKEFERLLDQPPKKLPKLRTLLSESSFDDDPA